MLDADTTLPPVASCRDAAGLTRFLSDLWAAVGRSEDLAYLARVIDQCEHRIGRSAAEMCHFYVLRGEALLRVKELVGHGGWLPWLAENTGYSPRQAQKYMRAARHRERLANAPSGTHLNGLLDLLVERDDDPGPDGTIRAEVGPVAEPVADDDPALSSDGYGAARGLTLPAVVDMVRRRELTARAVAPDLPPEERKVLKALHNEIKLQERAARRAERVAAAAAAPPNPALRADRHRLHRGDFRELAAELGPSSVDCIITDPPYPREHLPLYDALGEVAARVLKPGGRLLVMIDQSILREALNRLHPSMGETVWTLCYEMPGASVQKLSPATKIHSNWKPVLYYANGGNAWDFVRDTVQGGGTDKRFHGWQQDVPGFEELVRRFTVENELVFDPFACTATTGVATLHLGRRFVGAEVDPSITDVAGERLRLAAAGLPDELPAPVEKAA